MRDHYITLGMKSWPLDLCRSEEAAFDTFCEGSGPTFAYLFKPAASAHPMIGAERHDASPLETAICQQPGLKPGSMRD